MGVFVFALATPVVAAHAASAQSLGAAQSRLTNAIEKANAAAGAYDAAQTDFYRIQDESAGTTKRIAEMRVQQRQLGVLARLRAVVAYTGGVGLPLADLFGNDGDVLDAGRRATLLDRVDARGNAAIAQLTAVTDDLHAHERVLGKQLSKQKDLLADLKRRERAELAAVDDAKRAEDSVRKELAAEKRQRDLQAVLARARAAARASSRSASSFGGRSGQIIVHGNWLCPVQGPVSFTDTYGAPRGGGRTHKGTDMFSPLGTPTVAVTGGTMFFQGDGDGGNAAYVTGADGTTYYYAHLNDYVGGARSVTAGELIGHVGNTGDAAGGPTHLHFEIRPGGPNGRAIDPYGTLSSHC